MKRLTFIIVPMVFFLAGCGTLPDGVGSSEDFEKPSIKDAFCGINIDYQYCKCAFHGQFCKEINMSRKEANAYVQEQYEQWLTGKRSEFSTNCTTNNGYMDKDTCRFCEQGFTATKDACVPGEPQQVADEETSYDEGVVLPEGPYNEDCTLQQEQFDQDWKKYSDIDNAIAPEDRSYEAKQALVATNSMIAKLVESFEVQRDIDIEDQMQADLNEYRQALVQNQKANLLRVFWRMSWVTYSTIKSGVSAGKSFSNLLTSAGSGVQSLASGLKTVQATVPSNSSLAIDKSTLLGKAEVIGAKTALTAVESLGDPGKVAQQFMKSSFDVTVPSATLSEAEINILKQQQIDKGVVDAVLAKSKAENATRQARLTTLESEIKVLETQISEWEAKEKDRVATSLVESCQKLMNREVAPEDDAAQE